MNIEERAAATEADPRQQCTALAIARYIERVLDEYRAELVPDLGSLEGEFADRVGGCLIALNKVEADAAALECVIDALTEKRAAKLCASKHLKTQLHAAMNRERCTCVHTAFGSVRVQTSSQVVVDESFCRTASDEYVLTTREPKLRKLDDALRRGLQVPGARVVEVEHLVVT